MAVGLTTAFPPCMVYVLIPVGLIVNDSPEQITPLFTVIVGLGLTVNVKLVAGPLQPKIVAYTEYIPDIVVVELGIIGFCVELLKLGPVQLNVVEGLDEANKEIACPTHMLLAEALAVGAEGALGLIMLYGPKEFTQPLELLAINK